MAKKHATGLASNDIVGRRVVICPPPLPDMAHPRAIAHPGFGSIEVRLRDGRTLHYDVHGDCKHGPITFGGLAKRFVPKKTDHRRYELIVEGPLQGSGWRWSFARKAWVLTKRLDGFA